MYFSLSKFGNKLGSRTGILELMDDLGKAMAHDHHMRMLGGGNPAHIPEVAEIWRQRIQELLEQGHVLDKILGNYDTPQGKPEFIQALADCLNQHYGWRLTSKNIAVTNGSQTAFFLLFNMLAGKTETGSHKKILLPLSPEYIGYADQGIDENIFVAGRPRIEFIDKHTFKYRIDFENLPLNEDLAAICVSRPTNPTGNVLTDDEMKKLAEIAQARNIPLLVDNAYGAPFPDVIFTDAELVWNENTILVLSLSKLGLPGTRTGIIIAPEEIAAAFTAVNAVVSLANGNLGQSLALPLLRNGELLKISREKIRPFYKAKSDKAIEAIRANFGDHTPYAVHKSEGAFFLWLWFKDLPITAKELYQRLKARNVLVIPGHYFFYGLKAPWRHADECIRITFSQSDHIVREGIEIIADEVKKAYESRR